MRNLKRAFYGKNVVAVHQGTPREQKIIYVQQATQRSRPYSIQEVNAMQKLDIYESIEDGIEYASEDI